MFVLLLFGLLAAFSSCNLRENEAEIRKQLHFCKKLANNGNCDVDCMGFGSFEADDCKHVQFETRNYTIIVNAHPFMHSMESWKIVRENAEKRFYRRNLTIDITEEEYTNITNHCMKLIKESNFTSSSSSSSSEPSIFEYCPVEVNATFFVPQMDSSEVIDFEKECETKNNNDGVCEPMCWRYKDKNYEDKDCDLRSFLWKSLEADVRVFLTKQELLTPLYFWITRMKAIINRQYNVYLSHTTFQEKDVEETMTTEKKYLERHMHINIVYSNHSTFPSNFTNFYVLGSKAYFARSEEELLLLKSTSDKHL